MLGADLRTAGSSLRERDRVAERAGADEAEGGQRGGGGERNRVGDERVGVVEDVAAGVCRVGVELGRRGPWNCDRAASQAPMWSHREPPPARAWWRHSAPIGKVTASALARAPLPQRPETDQRCRSGCDSHLVPHVRVRLVAPPSPSSPSLSPSLSLSLALSLVYLPPHTRFGHGRPLQIP